MNTSAGNCSSFSIGSSSLRARSASTLSEVRGGDEHALLGDALGQVQRHHLVQGAARRDTGRRRERHHFVHVDIGERRQLGHDLHPRAFARPERRIFGTRSYEKLDHAAGITHVTVRDDLCPKRAVALANSSHDGSRARRSTRRDRRSSDAPRRYCELPRQFVISRSETLNTPRAPKSCSATSSRCSRVSSPRRDVTRGIVHLTV